MLLQLADMGFALAAPTPSEKYFTCVLMLLVPFMNGVVMTGLLDGRAGLRDLWSRLTR